MNDSAAIIPPITYYNKKIAYQQLYLQKLIAEPPLAIVRRMYGPSQRQINEANYQNYLIRALDSYSLYIKPENACKPKFKSDVAPQTKNLWDQHPRTWTSANKDSAHQLRTSAEIHPDEKTAQLATQWIISGIPNTSRTPQ